MNRLSRYLPAVVVGLTLAVPALAADIPDPVAGWNRLWKELVIDLLVIGVVFGIAAGWMLWRYRATSPDAVGQAPKLTKAQAIGWALIPSMIFMADDFFLSANGWTLWNVYRKVPDNAVEIKVTGNQWFWEFDYGNGVTNEALIVPAGHPVVLRMTAKDVIHSFFMPEYRVKEDVMPGRVTYLWFYPKVPGKTIATCTEFCGMAHATMPTEVIAMPAQEYEAWLAKRMAEAANQPRG